MFTHDSLHKLRMLSAGFKRLLISLGWAALISLTLFIPEWLFSYLLEGYTPYWDVREVAVVYLVVFFLINSYYKRLGLFAAGGLFFLQVSALMYYSYFGSFYGPSDVMLLFLDTNEVFSSAAGVIKFLILPLTVIGVAGGIFYWAYHRIHGGLLRSRFSSVMLVLLLIAPSINASLEDNSQHYEADSTSLAIKNALYSISYFLGGDLPKRISGDYVVNSYKPYQVTKVKSPAPYHVVVVMGESLNPQHMSLFGYARETTPFLDGLRADNNFVYRQVVSSGVSTRVSVPMFMNVQYEPDNWTHMSSKQSSLFRLAKQANFQTAFLTTQKMDGISSLLSSSDIDYWRDYRDKAGCGRYDDCLVDFMQALPLAWDKPAFLVLNQRSAHSPYDANYPADFRKYQLEAGNDYNSFMVNSYDDSVRYVDKNLAEVITYLKQKSNLPVLLVFTSDHGEKVGEDGKFGHNTLDFASARVPFLFYGINAPKALLDDVRRPTQLQTHYDIGKWLAHLFGYQINNPNELAGEYYINGVDLMGRAGFMKYKLSDLPASQLVQR